MSSEKYTYSVSGDFPNHKVDIPRLTEEIQTSAITIALDYIEVQSDDCNIWFKAALDGENRNRLDTIVANHSGEPLSEDVLPVRDADARFDSDKKQVVVITPAPRGTFTWYTGCGDIKEPLQRGAGQEALIEIPANTPAGTHTVELDFAEDGGVYIHDGEIAWKNMATDTSKGFGGKDKFSVYIKFPATPAPASTPNFFFCLSAN